jgi:hypothetical protein
MTINRTTTRIPTIVTPASYPGGSRPKHRRRGTSAEAVACVACVAYVDGVAAELGDSA